MVFVSEGATDPMTPQARSELIEKGARALYADYRQRAMDLGYDESSGYPLSWEQVHEIHCREAELVLVACEVIEAP
jgi:hypothetical protein